MKILNSMKLALSTAVAASVVTSCRSNGSTQEVVAESTSQEVVAPADTAAWVSLTVAEGKRLLAKGLVASAEVQAAAKDAAVIITRGSTNQYVLEEFLGEAVEDGSFLTGRIIPNGKENRKAENVKSEYIYQGGKLRQIASLEKELASLPKGSVVFKGGNILNHNQGKAAVLVGHPTGGTIGMIDKVLSDKVKLIVPIGLEKNSSVDIDFMSTAFAEKQAKAPAIHLLNGAVFTEIEAIKTMADVEVYQYAAGGIDGAEGGVSLLIRGSNQEVEKALAFVSTVYGEAAFYQK